MLAALVVIRIWLEGKGCNINQLNHSLRVFNISGLHALVFKGFDFVCFMLYFFNLPVALTEGFVILSKVN